LGRSAVFIRPRASSGGSAKHNPPSELCLVGYQVAPKALRRGAILSETFAPHDEKRLFVGAVADRECVKDVLVLWTGVDDDQVKLERVIGWADPDKVTSGVGGQGVQAVEDSPDLVTRETPRVKFPD
jgi:hypothetical protein